ncbi:hypothetical protein [Thermosulfurimonas sp. F29]|uniref:hypothetical protein n=1 Tax=Thermosulfurimonas sp. F29 TaxID=2867247 RepID=UPI001C82A282|nr:hypothetical protein [Thermosulfurimonas sp. F29]MBX6423810.1 hypothetical protein [Thermosulfurimonas sp. F29]
MPLSDETLAEILMDLNKKKCSGCWHRFWLDLAALAVVAGLAVMVILLLKS